MGNKKSRKGRLVDMKLHINEKSEKPIYIQLFEQISSEILSQELPPHYCLPSIRKIALELRISVITVKKTYDELEHRGLIYTIAGKGCFVSTLEESDLTSQINRILDLKFSDDIQYVKNLGITAEQLIDYIKSKYEE